MAKRRQVLQAIGVAGASCALAQHRHQDAPEQPASPAAPRFFTAAEFAVVSRLAGLIIPATETPGAIEVGVPAYIDGVLAGRSELQRLFRDGLAWLDDQARARHRKRFVELGEMQQVELLTPLCAAADRLAGGRRRAATQPGVEFFRAVKTTVADGYYTSRAGLIEELRYPGNQVLAEFPACVHEH